MQQFMVGSPDLPLRRPLAPAAALSLVTAVITAVASTAGLLFPDMVYPTEAQRLAFLTNDVVNLLLGLPILLGSLWLVRQGHLLGLLLWPGGLLFVLYNYVAYVVGRSVDAFTPVHLGLVLLSALTAGDLWRCIDSAAVGRRLAGRAPRRIAAWILIVFGAAFVLRAVTLMILGGSPAPPSAADLGVLIADMVLSLLWLAGGALLLRRAGSGYAGALGLLFAASALFVGLIVYLLIRPALTGALFDPVELLTVAGMGLVCFVPFGLYARAVWQAGP